MNKTTFGVLITSYNKERYIARALKSLISQTKRPDNICIVDDFSYDSSRNIIKEYIPKLKKCGINVTYIENSKNLGAAESRNIGIEHLYNDYIIFLDADDSYDPEYICKLNEIVTAEPEAGMICSSVRTEQKGNLLPSRRLINRFEDAGIFMKINNIYESLAIESIFIGGGNVCFKRNLTENEKFEIGEKNMEEWDYYYRVLKQCIRTNKKLIFVPLPLYIYNDYDEDSLSRKKLCSTLEIQLPKIISRLNSPAETGYRKLLLSIWIYSCITRLPSVKERIRYIRTYHKYIFSAKINRYWLGALISIICSDKVFEKIKHWKKAHWYK